MKLSHLLVLLILSVFVQPTLIRAQWQPDGATLLNIVGDQDHVVVIADGAGGAIVAWQDTRSSISADIYAQRIDAFGVPQWTTNGVAICTATNDQVSPAIVADGAGGAIVAWDDRRTPPLTGLYAQRINSAGVVQWAANGVALTIAAVASVPTIVSDGAGGANVAWEDFRAAGVRDIYARRVDAAGTPQGTANGVAVCTATNQQFAPQIVSDNAGGAIVVWEDLRTGGIRDIYAHRFVPGGSTNWALNGEPICTATGQQNNPTLVSNGNGGAILTWSDARNASDINIYAQHIDSAGDVGWIIDGVALCAAIGTQTFPAIVSDGGTGAIVAWQDNRSGTSIDIYAQRVGSTSAVQWAGDGVALCTQAATQTTAAITTDGAGGAIVTWTDSRDVGGTDIYAQRVSFSGVVQWTSNGVPLTTGALLQLDSKIAFDGAGGAIAVWNDLRSNVAYDVYAQRVEGTYGYWGHPEPVVTSAADIPNDQGGKVALNWDASGRDVPVPATIEFYSVWRAVDSAALVTNADRAGSIASIEDIAFDTAPGVRTSRAGSPYYWELVGTQTAYRWPHYSFSAETRADSIAGDSADEFFMVAAHDRTDDNIAFASNAVSGHSVDNLAPAAPLTLMAQRIGNYVYLKWNRVRVPDLRDYSVYRKTSSGVTPVPINFLSSANDTVLTDASAPTSALYYIVTAYDVHDNQSAPSNEASVGATTGVGGTPSITALTVLQNYPNPFTGMTDLQIGLPAPSDVQVEIYDVAGRRVSTLGLKQASAGWKSIPFSGRDSEGRALSSGVYFYRVTANGSTVTRKMVLAR